MSLQPQAICPVPEETARVAHAAYPKGNVYMRLRDVLGSVYDDEVFTSVFPHCGQPAEAPWCLALVSVMQFMEGLSDRQAADALRGRIDWKYTLGLELTDSGFDHSVLSEFRTRLVVGKIEYLLFDTLLTQLRERGYLKARGRQRTDSTHVLAAIRALNRLECVGETLRHSLNCLAIVTPDWLRERMQPEWVERYDHRFEDYRLPKGEAERQAHALVIGMDGSWLLDAIFAPDAPHWLREVPAVDILRRVWIQNYMWVDEQLAWRSNNDIPPASQFISSPYDLDAHYSKKRSTSWVGYKVHYTETCDEKSPHLITHVETTSAPISDDSMTASIHEHLKEKDLLPALHVVDTGYVDANLLVESQQDYQIDLFGPTRDDCQWQAHEARGFDAQHFVMDWQQQVATCPEGHRSNSWSPSVDTRGNEVIRIKFSQKDCGSCPSRIYCTRTTPAYPRRMISVRPQKQYQAFQAARERETTEGFPKQYALRAGIEGTISQSVRAFGGRRSRYCGLAKTHLQHLLIATGINLLRTDMWLTETPCAKTRHSAFVQLYQASSGIRHQYHL